MTSLVLGYLNVLAWPTTVIAVILLLRPVQVPPGPCPARVEYRDSSHERCQLRAGHTGLHQSDHDVWGDE